MGPCDRADSVLDPVVVDGQRAVVKEARQRLPTPEAIVDRFSHGRSVGRPLPLQQQPLAKLVGDRSRLPLPYSLSLPGAQFPRLAFDIVELSEQLQRFLGQRALVVDPQIVEFPARVRQTPNLGHPLGEQPLVPRVVVADELPRPAVEELLRVRRGTAVGEVVNDGLHGIELRRAVAPDVRTVRAPLARLEHRHRRLVGVQHWTLEQHRPQRIDQGL